MLAHAGPDAGGQRSSQFRPGVDVSVVHGAANNEKASHGVAGNGVGNHDCVVAIHLLNIRLDRTPEMGEIDLRRIEQHQLFQLPVGVEKKRVKSARCSVPEKSHEAGRFIAEQTNRLPVGLDFYEKTRRPREPGLRPGGVLVGEGGHLVDAVDASVGGGEGADAIGHLIEEERRSTIDRNGE